MKKLVACLALTFILMGCASLETVPETKTPVEPKTATEPHSPTKPKTATEILVAAQEPYAVIDFDGVILYEEPYSVKPFRIEKPEGFIIIGDWVYKSEVYKWETQVSDDHDAFNESYFNYYKIRLDSGREAYIKQNLIKEDPLDQITSKNEADKLNTTPLEYAMRANKEKLARKDRERTEREAKKKAEKEAFIKSLYAKGWNKTTVDRIIEKKISIGMTPEQTTLSWGKPKRVNESVGSYGRHEQWIYGHTYVYFQNGVLTSWQSSR